MRRANTPSPMTGRTSMWIAVSVVSSLALGVAAAGAQDLTGYKAGPNDRADSPAEGYDALYHAATTQPLIEECLKAMSAEGDAREACLGLTVEICLSYRINETTLGSMKCAAGERDAWEAVTAGLLASIAAKGDPGLRSAVDASQKAWEAHRLAACRIWGEVFRGGSLARQIGADCLREHAGRRAIDLMAVEEALVQ